MFYVEYVNYTTGEYFEEYLDNKEINRLVVEDPVEILKIKKA